MIYFVFVFVTTKNNNFANFALLKTRVIFFCEDKGNISAASVIDKLPIDHFMFGFTIQIYGTLH